MTLHRIVLALATVAAIVGGAAQPVSAAAADLRLQYLSAQQIPHAADYAGTVVGGFSGIDYDPATGVWYLISDDRWRYQPARFYTAELDIDPADGHFSGVRLTGVKVLRRADATAYPGFGKPESADPESIRFDPLGDRLIWANEGDRPDEGHPDIPLSQGSLRWVDTSGHQLADLPQPGNLALTEGPHGPRRNQSFEGIALTSRGIVAMTEGPRYEDGAPPTAKAGAPARITVWDRSGSRVLAQYAYPLDPVDAEDTGVSELLAIDDHRLLALERSWDPAHGYRVLLYEIDLREATDVLDRDSLRDASYRPVTKRLVHDLSSVPHPVENYEALAWGPQLMTGERTLVIASDDNFSTAEKSLFLLFKVAA